MKGPQLGPGGEDITWPDQVAPLLTTQLNCVISQGIWAPQKLSRGSILDLSKLQDPRTLGYLLIFGLYSKPIAYC